MNYRSVVNVVGFILIIVGLSMVFSIGWALYYNDGGLADLVKSMSITVVSGMVLALGTYSKKKKKKELSVRDGFAIVSIGWLFVAAFSALPFYFS